MKSHLTLTLLAAALAGCATHHLEPVVAPLPPPAAGTVATVQIWENPGTEFPTMCMLMQADGTLAFKGGFQFYNPASWRQDARTGQLTITLGGNQPFPAQLASEQLRVKDGALSGVNGARRELRYTISPATASIGLGGFYFYRSQACHAG